MLFPDGSSVTTLISARPIRLSEEGEITSVVVTMQDMTPLEEIERQRAEFLGNVSRGLRTPLTTIKGSTATVLSSPSPLNPAETQDFFQIIDDQAEQMRNMINVLLDATSIEAGMLQIIPEPTEVADVVDQARSEFLRNWAGTGVDVDLAPDLPRIDVDRQRIVQVLTSLLSISSILSTRGAVARETAIQQDNHVAFSVSDERLRIPSEHLPHLFKKFFWVDGWETNGQIGGAGLRLAICKGIVEANGAASGQKMTARASARGSHLRPQK